MLDVILGLCTEDLSTSPGMQRSWITHPSQNPCTYSPDQPSADPRDEPEDDVANGDYTGKKNVTESRPHHIPIDTAPIPHPAQNAKRPNQKSGRPLIQPEKQFLRTLPNPCWQQPRFHGWHRQEQPRAALASVQARLPVPELPVPACGGRHRAAAQCGCRAGRRRSAC